MIFGFYPGQIALLIRIIYLKRCCIVAEVSNGDVRGEFYQIYKYIWKGYFWEPLDLHRGCGEAQEGSLKTSKAGLSRLH
jgi:hypothetical protein